MDKVIMDKLKLFPEKYTYNKVTLCTRVICIIVTFWLSCSCGFMGQAIASTYPTFTVNPKSAPKYNPNHKNKDRYNQYTKNYYTLRDRLEKIEKEGGGTLLLKKGVYSISNNLYVPSNTTIILNDGVIIKKTRKTGTKKVVPTKTIFQLIRPGRANKKAVYGKYKGEKNIQIIGEGNAIIDMNFHDQCNSIVLGHNQKIEIKNIKFINSFNGHFIELDASRDVLIQDCNFSNSKKSGNWKREAINIDIPDKLTNGFGCLWSKFDKTPNEDIKILSCTFSNMPVGIGTHKYSRLTTNGALQYHTGIIITDCSFTDMLDLSIDIMAWKDSIVASNTASGPGKYVRNGRAFRLRGVNNVSVKRNNLKYADRVIEVMPFKLDYYGAVKNKVTSQNRVDYATNTCNNTVIRPHVAIYQKIGYLGPLYGTEYIELINMNY